MPLGKGINPYPAIGENQGHYHAIRGKGLNSTLPLLFEDFALRGLVNDPEYAMRLQKPIKFARQTKKRVNAYGDCHLL
jgi:hypothetical protein